jgi:hypothetical protein
MERVELREFVERFELIKSSERAELSLREWSWESLSESIELGVLN